MNNTYLNIEHTFYHIACQIHAMGLSPQELKSNRDLYNALASAAYDFFETVALRSSSNARSIALSCSDPSDICCEVTMHYLNKFHRLWESSSPEYYMASVMTQVHRKVLDIVEKNRFCETVPLEDVELYLTDSSNTEHICECQEDVNSIVSLLANQVNGMDAIYFLARFALNIKPGNLAKEFMTHDPREVICAILKTCARQTAIEISLLEQIASNVMNDSIPTFGGSQNSLAETISDHIYSTKQYVKKAMAKSTIAFL